MDTDADKIVEAIEEALGETLERISTKPYDTAHKDTSKLNVRVLRLGWDGSEPFIGSGKPPFGRESILIQVFASWQGWDYGKIRDENRKIIRALENRDWQFSSVNYAEDGDRLIADISFTHLDVAPY